MASFVGVAAAVAAAVAIAVAVVGAVGILQPLLPQWTQ
jgi:hypothetical protein